MVKKTGHSLRSVSTYGRKSGHWVSPYAKARQEQEERDRSFQIQQEQLREEAERKKKKTTMIVTSVVVIIVILLVIFIKCTF